MKQQPLIDWFSETGAYVLVDGQFGSTGKGLMAGYIADLFVRSKSMAFNVVTTNAGPNSGHTAYFGNMGGDVLGEKIVTQQVPVAAVFAAKYGCPVPTILNAGAVIDHKQLNSEIVKWRLPVFIHPCAAMITPDAVREDEITMANVASTGKGVGPAIMNKIARRDKQSIAMSTLSPMLPPGRESWDNLWDWGNDTVFVETAQGFSLGLNSARFYPYTTSRECTAVQALADARIPAQVLRKVLATYRTYPIRVGNTERGYSGSDYPDQRETTWEEVGVAPEITTVTGRVRRVFEWSRIQFRESIAANRPNAIFINFMNYLPNDKWEEFMHTVGEDYAAVMGDEPEDILIGTGPYSSDVLDWRTL